VGPGSDVRDAQRESRRGVLLATIAVFFFSTSPVLIIWAEPLSPYAKTAGRLAVAALAIWLLMRLRGERVQVARGDLRLFLLFGLITALHFLFYVASINYTTIAHALAIVYTAPIFVALFSAWFLKEPVSPRQWAGVLVAVAGVAVLAGFEPRWNSAMALGDLLALGSAITFGLYSVAGRGQRARYPLFTYAVLVYGLAALWALPAAVFTYQPGSFSLRAALAVIALGIFPLGFGHTLYNAALRHTNATTVNLIATLEVIGGIVLGMLLVGATPQPNEIIGAAVILSGITLVVLQTGSS
jgi:drug/metabolite transporter (DMT)-like permease